MISSLTNHDRLQGQLLPLGEEHCPQYEEQECNHNTGIVWN